MYNSYYPTFNFKKRIRYIYHVCDENHFTSFCDLVDFMLDHNCIWFFKSYDHDGNFRYYVNSYFIKRYGHV